MKGASGTGCHSEFSQREGSVVRTATRQALRGCCLVCEGCFVVVPGSEFSIRFVLIRDGYSPLITERTQWALDLSF
jgi:hypothetical protein